MEHTKKRTEKKQMQTSLLDIRGDSTGYKMDKKFIFSIVGAAVLIFAGTQMTFLSEYGETAGAAFGLLMASLFVLVYMPAHILVPSMLIVVLGAIMGMWDVATIKTTFGNSPFIQALGMTLVALGCEFTPIGERLAYIFLKKFGKRPVLMAVVVGVFCAVVSAFISNVATIIMMSSIVAGILRAAGEKPGESKLGMVCMLLVVAASKMGGFGLFSGSVLGNTAALNYVRETTGYTLTYSEWAKISIPCFVVAVPVMCFIYIKFFNLKNDDVHLPPSEYYDEKLKELGRITGAEIRWMIILFGMIVCMLLGADMNVASLLFAALAMCPGIGVLNCKTVWNRVPIAILLSASFLPLMAKLFSDHGLNGFVSDLLGPVFSSFGPFGFMIVTTLVLGIMLTFFVNAQTPVNGIIFTCAPPIALALGYNPAVVMFPALFTNGFFFAHGANATTILNRDYGYWSKTTDPMGPGLILIACTTVIFSIITYFLAPLLGMPLYL